jgi:predicted nuclease of predicted toxin-antitoxin system
MIIWLDAQLSPAIASWMSLEFSVSAIAVRDLGLRDAKDQAIFSAARQANAVVMTKDIDFVHLVEQSGVPPQVILLACGNTSNAQLKQILKRSFDRTIEWLQKGEPVVEITIR